MAEFFLKASAVAAVSGGVFIYALNIALQAVVR